MSSCRSLVLLTLFSFLVVSFAGCDRCRSDDAEAAQQSVAELAVLVPANADTALVVPKIEDLPPTFDYALRRMGHVNPDARAYATFLRRQLGVDLTDVESWEEAGFDTDGSLMISLVSGRPVFTAHLDDEDDFEETVIANFRRQLGTQGGIEDETIAGRSFRVSGDDAGDDMAWFFDDSRVVWVMPPFDAFAVYESGSAASVANKLGGLDEDTSLANSDSFVQFQKGIGNEFPVSIFFDVALHMDSADQLPTDALGVTGVDTLIDGLTQWSQANAGGAGVGLRAGDQRLEIRTFAGGDDELIAKTREFYSTDADIDWQGLLTERIVVGTRTSFDLQRTVDTYLETLPDEHRRMIRREMQQLSDQLGLDVEEDVLGAFSGHTTAAFYGVTDGAGSVPRLFMTGRIERGVQTLLSNMGLLVSFHFADVDKMNQLADTLEDQARGLVRRNALTYQGSETDDVEILAPASIRAFPLRLAIKDDVVTLATAGISEDDLYEYLTASRSETLLADSDDHPLGAQFAESDNPNGLYLNFANLRRNMRNISLLANYAGTIEFLHELLMVVDVDDHGIYVDTIVQFTDPLAD